MRSQKLILVLIVLTQGSPFPFIFFPVTDHTGSSGQRLSKISKANFRDTWSCQQGSVNEASEVKIKMDIRKKQVETNFTKEAEIRTEVKKKKKELK